MRVAALYDVHGNLPALEAVLADPRCAEAELLVCGGDLVAGPMPAECLERLLALGDRVLFVRGNGDRETVSPPAAGPLAVVGRFAHDRLTKEHLVTVAAWPLAVEAAVPGLGLVVFCHATPLADTPIVTGVTPERDLRAALGPLAADVVVCGHTHVQFDRVAEGVRVVNAGSVGAPYHDGRPAAYWALLGPGVELVSTPYDVGAALETLRSTGLPTVDEWLGPALRGEVTAAEATRVFEERRVEAVRAGA